MNNKILLLLLAFFVLTTSAYAQGEDPKKAALSIKKNSEYIYGEAAGDDSEDVLYEMAHEKLVERIKQYVASQPNLAAADGVLIDRVRQKTKKITYTRGIETKVLCLYVKKAEILPLAKNAQEKADLVVSNSASEEPVAEEPLSKDEPQVGDLRERQAALHTIEQKRHEAEMETGKSISYENITIEDPKDADSDEGDLSEEDMAKMAEELTPAQYKMLEDIVAEGEDDPYVQKRVMLLAVVSKLKTYDRVQRFLLKRQVNDGGLIYKLTTSFDHEDCFWAIFNGRQELVALLSPDLDFDLIKQQAVDGRKKYARGAKLWIRFL